MGAYPARRHDGSEWKPGTRDADRAGHPMHFRGFVTQLKADWAEWGSSFGLASHAATSFPCACCVATKEDWHQIDDAVFEQLPWIATCQADCEAACEMCEVEVVIPNRQHHARVRGLLAFDKKPNKGRGRVMEGDYLDLGLLKGDRLEPSSGCREIGVGFDAMAPGPYPITLVFWRRNAETAVRHRCPIMDLPGCSVHILMIDTLHCVYLGVVPIVLEACIWLCVINNVWRVGGAAAASRDEICISMIRAELFEWYKKHRQAHPGRNFAELQDLMFGMLGTRKSHDGSFSPEGAEARWMIPFVNEMLLKHKENLPKLKYDVLIAAGTALESLVTTMHDLPAMPTRGQCKAIGYFKQYE
eukprot:13785154-Heterocapsa_arctica.AAC.2